LCSASPHASRGTRHHVVELGPGDYLRWDGLVPHDAEAIGDESASMLIVRLTRHGEPHD
jgi:uncharacterized RmlC-like cupin family protein